MFDQVTGYVVWREGSPNAELGRKLWRWFNVLGDDGLPSAAGIPVYFRSMLAEDGALSPQIAERGPDPQTLNLVLLLIDDHWMEDPDWCDLPGQLVGRGDVVVRYVALTGAAAASHPALGTMQALIPKARPGEAYDVSLRRAVTQAFARAVRTATGLADAKPQVFVSHAKRDGRDEAVALKAAIHAYGQIDAYFDEADIAWGSNDWAGQLQAAVLEGSAGMLVLETDAYASRPWCRAEAELARVPRRLAESGVDAQIWSVVPTVVLGRPGASWSKVLPELGNVPRIGCEGDYAIAALDRLMLEILLAAVNRLRARSVAAARPGAKCVVLTWSPDPESIRRVREAVGPLADLVYPGDGLYRFEVARLLRGDASAARGRVCLHTYADWVHVGPQAAERRVVEGTLVAVSVSESPDRAKLGFGADHEDAALTRLTQELVRVGARVLYGGVLADKGDGSGQNKLRPILDAVVGHARGREAGEGLPKLPPLVNAQALPFYRSVPQTLRNELRGVVQFVTVDPPGWREAHPTYADTVEVGVVSAPAATALRELRRAMARGATLDRRGRVDPSGTERLPPTTLRVAMGGKVQGYLGLLPGIAEEYLEDREAGRPVLALRKYGGCAGQVASYLLGEPLPRELTWAWVSAQPWYQALLEHVPATTAEARWEALTARLDADRAALAAGESIVPGMSVDALKALMVSESDGEVIAAVVGLLPTA
jgi:hypothetical protein